MKSLTFVLILIIPKKRKLRDMVNYSELNLTFLYICRQPYFVYLLATNLLWHVFVTTVPKSEQSCSPPSTQLANKFIKYPN